MSAEKDTETTPNINVITETEKVINKVSTMDFNSVLNEWIIPYGIKILLAIAIFVIGKFLAQVISRLLGKAALKSTKDEMLQSFITSISYFLLLLIVVIASLSQIGINTSSLVALIGAAGLAIGLSLQNSLQNFAAGVMLLIFKPFRKGDVIETSGMTGVVEQMGLLVLELRTGDNKTVLLPNGKVFSDKMVNYSNNPTRRIDFTFEISYSSNLKEAKEVIQRILEKNHYVLKDPTPVVAVGSLSSDSIQLIARPWVQTTNYWVAYWDILEQIKLEFDNLGISIPEGEENLTLKNGTLDTKGESQI